MHIDDILRMRLRTQLVEHGRATGPHGVVAHLAAMQAQDYLGALWSIALRLPGAISADIEAAIAEGTIVRTWPMSGTLHFVTAEDVRWLLPLLTPRIIARAATRRAGLGLTSATFDRARELFSAALVGGKRLTRPEAMALLEAGGVDPSGQRGYHVLWQLSQDGLLCCGPMAGKQQTFVLLDEWVPRAASEQDAPPRDVALARLAGRYVTGHGPATLEDFAWWAGLKKSDARAGLEAVAEKFEHADVAGKRYWFAPGGECDTAAVAPKPAHAATPRVDLLPGFDEFMLGYTDRTLQLGEHRDEYGSSVSANGMFLSTIVINGGIAGMWKRTLKRDRVEISLRPFRPFAAEETTAIVEAATRYGTYLGLPAVLVPRAE